jgi:hypothetical protein
LLSDKLNSVNRWEEGLWRRYGARVRGDDAEAERQLREVHRLYVEIGATGHTARLEAETG